MAHGHLSASVSAHPISPGSRISRVDGSQALLLTTSLSVRASWAPSNGSKWTRCGGRGCKGLGTPDLGSHCGFSLESASLAPGAKGEKLLRAEALAFLPIMLPSHGSVAAVSDGCCRQDCTLGVWAIFPGRLMDHASQGFRERLDGKASVKEEVARTAQSSPVLRIRGRGWSSAIPSLVHGCPRLPRSPSGYIHLFAAPVVPGIEPRALPTEAQELYHRTTSSAHDSFFQPKEVFPEETVEATSVKPLLIHA